MSNKLRNIFLLQRIMRELKSNNPDTDFWNKISTSTWNEIIKNKLFKAKCSKIDGQAMKALQTYTDNIINYLQHPKNNDTNIDRDQRTRFQPIFDCITETLNLPKDSFTKGITEKELLKLIKNFKENFIPPKPSNNPYGRRIGIGGNETMLVGTIVEEIIKQGFLGTKTWASTITKITGKLYDKNTRDVISGWKRNRGSLKDKYFHILEDIASELEFDMKYWSDIYSLETKTHINIFKEKYLKREKIRLDFGIFNEHKRSSNIDQEEKKALKLLKELHSPRDLLTYFDTPSNYKIFKTSPSDLFLKEAMEILYDRGAYTLINDIIFTEFSIDFLATPEMKLFCAHVYGSEQVKLYLKAFNTLEDIDYSTHIDESLQEKFSDIRTAQVSNILRHKLEEIDENTNIKDLEPIFEKATDLYSDIFLTNPHYYPGINYAYMLDIGLNFFPKSELFEADTIEGLLFHSQNSIDTEKKSDNIFDRYYATISEAEFNALQDTFDQASLHKDLVDINPSQDMLIRTIRQINFYENTLLKQEIEPKQSMKDLKKFLIDFADREA